MTRTTPRPPGPYTLLPSKQPRVGADAHHMVIADGRLGLQSSLPTIVSFVHVVLGTNICGQYTA